MPRRRLPIALALLVAPWLHATPLDDIGVTALRAEHPELTGAGVIIGLPEAQQPENSSRYQVNPTATGHPATDFRYYDTSHPYGGAGATFDPALVSGHANTVGANLVGTTGGAAPGVTRIENFEANYFINRIIANRTTTGNGTFYTPVPINSRIVNQSFAALRATPAQTAEINRFYDAYATLSNVVFVSGNVGTAAPASMFNGISVGPVGKANTGGLHLVAPGGAPSYASPYVSGIAALLLQANDLGRISRTTANPGDARVIKAVLLNGATKTEGWQQTETNPLDTASGAGLVNAKASYDNFAAGQQTATLATTMANAADISSPTFAGSTAIDSLAGWDLRSLTASSTQSAAQHYLFDLSQSNLTDIALTATITWRSLPDLALGTNAISNFDLYLVNVDTGSIVLASRSAGENVEHLSGVGLIAARYDLQVVLRGGSAAPTFTDSFALAYSFDGAMVAAVPETRLVALLPILLLGLVFLRKRHRRAR
jgi:hypothetical protein